MIKIAITGNIACGKSVAFNVIKSAGYSVIDCDDIVKNFYNDNNFIVKVSHVFPEILSENKINLKFLSEKLFSDKKFKSEFESFIFPKVKEKITDYYKENENSNKVFIIVPLLFEAGFENLFDKIIFIQADENIRKQRLINRKSMLSEKADVVLKSQICEEEKIPKCDYVLKNNGTIEEFKRTVNDLVIKII